jgi:acyl-homoserine lactone acylase PvdQ
MQAWADGLNYYLHTHPQVSPRVLRRFEPWMALTFSEGSIGGDIERVNLAQLEAFYGKRREAPAAAEPSGRDEEPRGSNGIAIAASNTRAGHALLLINPHTSFYFRAEAQATSDEGLNAYGALTWGQFFVYQGFNERAGWMHTSSGADAWDEYLETVVKDGERLVYRYGGEQRPLQSSRIVVPFKTATGMDKKEFTVYRTQHGPIVRELDGKWVSMRLMHEPVKALQQSYLRTKARDYKAFRETMELHTNSSNNTIFADASGTIAYFHANFIPRRDARFDWTKPVDGSDPATEWQGLLSVDESPNLLNPKSGWLYNVNNWPGRPPEPAARGERSIRPMSRTVAPRARAAGTRSGCSRDAPTSRSTRWSRPRTTATFRPSSRPCPPWWRPTTRCPTPTRARRRSPSRSRSCAAGTTDSRSTPWRRRWRSRGRSSSTSSSRARPPSSGSPPSRPPCASSPRITAPGRCRGGA